MVLKRQRAQETYCWKGPSPWLALTFFSAVSRPRLPTVTLPAHPSLRWPLAPSWVTVTVGGGVTCVYRSPVTPPNLGDPAELSRDPVAWGKSLLSTFLSENEAVRPLIFTGPFCSDPSVTPWLGTPLSCTVTGWRWGCLPINYFHARALHPARSDGLLNSIPRINLCLDSE